jgi:RNA methyltransferase, TrmH family
MKSQLYVTESYQDWRTDLKKNLVSEKRMRQLSDTQSPQGIIACVPIAAISPRSVKNSSGTERSVYFHEIQDPGNLGTVLRTLAWFGGFSCLLSPGCVDPFNPKVVRASMGALFHVPLELDVPLPDLAMRFARIGVLDMAGDSMTSPAFSKLQCLVFGNEARGTPHDQLSSLGAKVFSIPGSRCVDSLNLASVANMCIYELNRDPNS